MLLNILRAALTALLLFMGTHAYAASAMEVYKDPG